MKILIVEDDTLLLKRLETNLKESGFTVETATSGLEGLDIAKQGAFDLLLVDVMLPEINGFFLVDRLRETSSVPIIMITARDALSDRVEGLNLGADDYLCKPFHFEELLARIQALLRRNKNNNSTLLTNGPIALDTEAKIAKLDGEIVELTAREILILNKMMTRIGSALSAEYLANYLSTQDERSCD